MHHQRTAVVSWMRRHLWASSLWSGRQRSHRSSAVWAGCRLSWFRYHGRTSGGQRMPVSPLPHVESPGVRCVRWWLPMSSPGRPTAGRDSVSSRHCTHCPGAVRRNSSRSLPASGPISASRIDCRGSKTWAGSPFGPAGPDSAGWPTRCSLRESLIADRHQVSRALARFASGAYDLVWCFDVRAWVLAGAPDLAPAVIDLDDLEHFKIWGRLAIDPTDESTARRPVSAWPARQSLFAARSLSLGPPVSLGVDPGRANGCLQSSLTPIGPPPAGSSGVAVVPNAYARPDRPVGRSSIGSPPVVLFHGTLRYPPNADAARWLVGRIAPALRELVPDVQSVWWAWGIRATSVSMTHPLPLLSGRCRTS